jgi:3-oxoacyl-[acyl-carrier-protein] synthase-1
MRPLAITAFTATTSVGPGNARFSASLGGDRSGLVPNDYTDATTGVGLDTFIGRVTAVDDAPLPGRWHEVDCRNHRLAWLGLHQDGFIEAARETIERLGPARVAVFCGTSTSTIEASERAYRRHAASGSLPPGLARNDLHHLHATTAFVREVLGSGGPAGTVSTACSSSAKVFAQAARMIEVGVVDAAIVGGIDSLAASTLFGFNALGLISAAPCRPFDVRRDGISIGEAAGFAIVERFDPRRHAGQPLLIGYGESSDAYHMTSPHPDGLGAMQSIDDALRRADVGAAAVDYINLHGTATPKNDAIEAELVADLFDDHVRASSTKGWTGHTLGAAGIVDAVVCLLAMRDGFTPGTLGCREPDRLAGPQIRVGRVDAPVGIALSNTFGFGGNNCVLAFARDADSHRRAHAGRPS